MTDDIANPPAPSPALTMTPRQRRFVDEYLIDFNAQQAFMRAGYAPTSRRSAWRLMRVPAVRAAIEAGQQELAAACRVSAERVIAEYVRMAFASVNDYLDIGDDGRVRLDLAKSPPERLVAIADVRAEETVTTSPESVRVRRFRLKLASKLHALDSLSRHLELFTRRQAYRGPGIGGEGDGEGGDLGGRDLEAELREARDRVAHWDSCFPDED